MFLLSKKFLTHELNEFVYALITKIPGETGEMIRRYWFRRKFRKAGDFRLLPNVHIEFPERLSIGNRSGINRGTWINAVGGIVIGNDVQIGPYVVIHSANHRFDRTDIPIREQGLEKKRVIIEDNVWIGAHAMILPGVVVGTGSVIGGGAVVTKDIPPYSIVVGNPARVIRKRIK